MDISTKCDKVVAICDRNCNIIAPFVIAPGNRNESVLLKPSIKLLSYISRIIGLKLVGSILSLDGVYNSRKNRKAIFNLGMSPNILENKSRRKRTKRGKKQLYNPKILAERFSTIVKSICLGRQV